MEDVVARRDTPARDLDMENAVVQTTNAATLHFPVAMHANPSLVHAPHIPQTDPVEMGAHVLGRRTANAVGLILSVEVDSLHVVRHVTSNGECVILCLASEYN